VDESQEGTSNSAQEAEKDLLPSGSVPSSESVQWECTIRNSTLLSKSQRENILRHCFKIEGEAFMYAPLETDESKIYQEAMKSSSSAEWKLTMLDEIETMRKNQIWD